MCIKSLSYVELIIFFIIFHKHGESNFDVEKFVQQSIKIFEQTAMIFMSSGTTGLPKGMYLHILKHRHDSTSLYKF